MNRETFKVCLSVAFLLSSLLLPAANFSLYNLRCEHSERPLAVETQHPRFSWKINAQTRGFSQTAWQILVADSPEKLLQNNGNLWDSGKRQSEQSVLVPYGGNALEAGKNYYWKVRAWDKEGNASEWSSVENFAMGLLSEKDWNRAQWIALEKDVKDELMTVGVHGMGDADKYVPKEKKIGMYKLPQFRKEFTAKKAVRRAMAYISGLGQFEMFLNGEKVGNHFLDPGWTKYDKYALYVPFDLSEKIHKGKNAVGIMLGNGFFNIPRERYFKLLASYGAPRVIMTINIEYEDGTKECIKTDKSWKAIPGPITYSSIYGGENYDANLEQEGWTRPGFNDKVWKPALETGWTTGLVAQNEAPLTVRDTICSVRKFKNRRGSWVYDLGQNFSGIIRLVVNAHNGSEIKLYPAELLNSDSTVNQSASGAPFWFAYTPKGVGRAVWQPQFTYYGFRYVQVEGAVPQGAPNENGWPEILDIKGLHTTYNAETAGTFVCSKPLFNQAYSLIDWAVRSNMASVLTDCPHREKLGWLEQSHLMQFSLMFNYNLASLYHKIMADMQAAQTDEGLIPDIAPEYVPFQGGFRDSPEWGSAFIIAPWHIYRWYGDAAPIEKYYDSMLKYVNYLSSTASGHIVSHGLSDWLDIAPRSSDGLPQTPNGVTATAIYYYDVCLIRQMAELLGRRADVEKYRRLAEEIKAAFNKKYWNAETGQYDRNSQTTNAMALYMGLVTDENRQKVLQNLIDNIRSNGNALTAGDVGYSYVLRALDEGGASDVIYDMNSAYDTPGYGWQLSHGATALTESWQAFEYLSHNHLALGHIMEWFYSRLGGIGQSDNSIAYKHIVFMPTPLKDIRSARATYESPYGTIVSDWKDSEDKFELKVEVPANSRASVCLPTSTGEAVSESGLPLNKVDGATVGMKDGKVVVEIGSGSYRFKVKKRL